MFSYKVSWRDLSTRIGKVFGARRHLVRLCYAPSSASQVEYIDSEEQLRTALHEVQRKWQLGAGDGVLHCAIDLAHHAPSSTTASAGGGVDKGASKPDLAGSARGAGAWRGGDVGKTADGEAASGCGGGEGTLTSLHLAARANDAPRVRALLSGDGLRAGESKVGVNARDCNGSTPLHYASSANALEAAEVLIEYSCDVNLADTRKCVPLHLAASIQHEANHQEPPAPHGLHGGQTGGGGGGDGGTLPRVSFEGVAEEEGKAPPTREKEWKERKSDEVRGEVRTGGREDVGGGGQMVKLLLEARAHLNARDSAAWQPFLESPLPKP